MLEGEKHPSTTSQVAPMASARPQVTSPGRRRSTPSPSLPASATVPSMPRNPSFAGLLAVVDKAEGLSGRTEADGVCPGAIRKGPLLFALSRGMPEISSGSQKQSLRWSSEGPEGLREPERNRGV